MTHDETFIRRCIALSEEAVRQGDEPFGALLVVDERGRSSAGRRRARARERATLYTSTEPCAMCCGAIYWSRIPRVVFGCSAGEFGALTGGSLVIPSGVVFGAGRRQVEVVGPLLETEALAVHRAYWSAR